MAIKVITPPDPQITTEDLRAHCNSVAADDAMLDAFLLTAQEYCEHYTGRAFGEQVVELALDEFPPGSIALPHGPVGSITSIKYIDTAGVEQTLSNTLYTLDDYGIQHWAVPAFETEWPDTMAVANAVKVRYAAGFFPPAARSAMLLLVAHYYANREASAPTALVELPLGATSLLNTVKVWGF